MEKTGRSTESLKKPVAEEMMKFGNTWKDMKKSAKNRVRWRRDVSAAYSSLSENDYIKEVRADITTTQTGLIYQESDGDGPYADRADEVMLQ